MPKDAADTVPEPSDADTEGLGTDPVPTGADDPDTSPRRDLKWRRRLVVALVVLTSTTTFVSAIAVWSHGVLLKTDRWVATVGPLAEDEEITDAVGIFLVNELVKAIDLEGVTAQALPDRASALALPISSSIQGFLTTEVQKLLRTPEFQKFWIEANRVAHEQIVRLLRGEPGVVYAQDGEVSLNLIPLLVRVLDKVQPYGILPDTYDSPDITRTTPPDEAVATLSKALGRDLKPDFGQVKVFESETLAQAQDGLKIFDQLVYGLVFLTVALAFASVALSLNRRRTILQLGLGMIIALVVTGAVLRSTSNYVLSLVKDDVNRSAAADVLDAVLQSLRQIEYWVLGLGILLAVAAWIVGDSRSAQRVRSWFRKGGIAGDAAVRHTVAFLFAHRDGLRIGGVVVALAALILTNLTYGSLAVITLLLGVYELALYLVTRHPLEAGDTGEPTDGPSPEGDLAAT